MAGDEKRLTESITRLDRRDHVAGDPTTATRPSAAHEHDQEHDMTSPTQKRHDEHQDPLAKVIWDAASRESSLDLPPWESLNGDRRVAHDVARAVREYLRDAEGLVSAVTDQSICDEEIVRTAPTTSPAQRRHDEILGRLDALIDAVKHGDKQPGPEPVDVTEEPPAHSHLWDYKQSVTSKGYVMPAYEVCIKCGATRMPPEPVDTAPDVDPDDARGDPEAWRQVAKIMEERAEHYAAEAKANNEGALSRLADVERLTRERDDLRGRVEDLIRERGQAIERYKALRQDVDEFNHKHREYPGTWDLVDAAGRDYLRGRDA